MTSLAPGARRFALPPLLAALPLAVLAPPLGAVALALGVFVILFFRDPERTPPPRGVVSPADGRVSVVREEDGRLRVGVFMGPFDVHVLRAPLSGTVDSLAHSPGAYRPAFTKDSERNERVDVTLLTGDTTDDGGTEGDETDVDPDGTEPLGVSMIAGWFARRIYPYLAPDDAVARGERIGHIAFGSRADVLLPPGYDRGDLRVAEGDRVRAGETVVALRR